MEKRTEISELGEFGLIERIAPKGKRLQSSSVKGIGDDAAVLTEGDIYRLVSSDMLLEQVHFDLAYVPLQHLGYKAVAVNISDIAAMNGQAQQITVNIAVSNRFSVEAIEALYSGIHAACEAYQVDLVGGDTTSSSSGLVISVTALGVVKEEKITYRNGASTNEILCVTGDLGAAYVGLQVLEREKQVFISNPEMQPMLDQYRYIVGRQLKPEARVDVVESLAANNIVPTSMIDLSDGLASDLLHICKASEVGATIFEDKLPIATQTYETAVELSLDPITCSLNGGEDYELLFTIKQDDFEKLKGVEDVTEIGFINPADEGAKLITKSGTEAAIKAQGWKHF